MNNADYDVSLKTELDDLQVEFECSSTLPGLIDDKRQLIYTRLEELDSKIAECQKEVDRYNAEIERLTYNGDTGDLILAVSSGVLTGVLDIVFVGECGLFKNASDSAKEKFQKDLGNTHESLNIFILNYAKKKGYKGERLSGAIDFLEKKYPVAQDNVWKGKGISSPKTHHLDDLAHHPSVLGLISAIAVQYLRISVFANKDGDVKVLFVKPTKKEILQIIVPVIVSGLIFWLVNLAEKKMVEYDEELPKPIRKIVENLHKAPIALSILKTSLNWMGHLVSDMGGSHKTAGAGEGIPGVFLSFLKELSMLPGFKDSKLPKALNDLYRHNQNKQLDKLGLSLTNKLDLRAELTVAKEQCMPVIVNEVIVRSVYFVRHLIIESKDKEIKDIEWSRVIPFYNRTIVRMMTVATGTFTAVDLIDAAAETAIKNPEACASVPTFLGAMLLRVNFVGIGRFAIAVTTDVAMGVKKVRDESERAVLMQNLILSGEARMYYKLADSQLEMANLHNTEAQMYDEEASMWKQVEQTQESMDELYGFAHKVGNYYAKAIENMNASFDGIEESVADIREEDPEFIDELLKRLK